MKKKFGLLLRSALLFCIILSGISCRAQEVLETTIAKIAEAIDGRVGVYGVVIETGASLSYHGDDRFPMQSVYKFPIGMAILDLVDQGKLSLDQKINVDTSEYISENGHSPIRDKYPGGTELTVRQLLNYSVMESDGSASDVLLRLLGGTVKAEDYVRRLGIQDIAIATTEKIQVSNDLIQYRNWATPKAMSTLFSKFYKGKLLSLNSQALLLRFLSPRGAWFSRRLKGLLPEGTPVYHKTGTAGTTNGLTRATNDAGIVILPGGQHLALSVFIADSHADQKEREITIAKITKTLFDYYSAR